MEWVREGAPIAPGLDYGGVLENASPVTPVLSGVAVPGYFMVSLDPWGPVLAEAGWSVGVCRLVTCDRDVHSSSIEVQTHRNILE